jgi:hypothetical protein
LSPGAGELQLSATDDNAHAKSCAEEIQHFAEIDLRLDALEKLHPLLIWEVLGNSTDEHVCEWHNLKEERTRCIQNLEQFGKSREFLEDLSKQLRKQADENSIREALHQLVGISSATAEPSEPQEQPTADASKGFDGLGQKQTDLSQYFDAAELTERQRECASLKWEYGLGVTEIARRLGLGHHSTVQEVLKAVDTKLHRDENFKRALKRRASHRSSNDESN